MAKTKSIWPWASIAVLNSLVSEVHCVTSVWTKVKEPGAGGGLISALTIFAPRELRSSTVARPMPEEQPVKQPLVQVGLSKAVRSWKIPVTITTLPSNLDLERSASVIWNSAIFAILELSILYKV